MARKFRRKTLLAKIEPVYGTDSVPTGALNAILTRDMEISEFEGPTAERNTDRAALGNDITYHVGIYSVLKFKVELAGRGSTQETPPAYGPLLRMCGLAETAYATVGQERVEYTPVSSGEESGSLYFNMDGMLMKLLGARGKSTFGLDPGGMPYMDFEIWGLRVAATDAALPTADYSAFQVPRPVNDANTPTFSLHAYAANMIGLSIDLGQQLVYRNVVGEESIQIVDRAPKGQVTIEDVLVATKDYRGIVTNHTLGALQLIHGTVSGNIVQVDASFVQLLKPRGVNSDGVAALQMDLNLTPNVGNDEFKLTIK